jgi:putative transposase
VTNYRRNFICGGSFFFTANLAERRLRLLVDDIDLLRQAFRYVRRRLLFAERELRKMRRVTPP